MRHSLLLALFCHFSLAGLYWWVTPALEAPQEEIVIERASLRALRGITSAPDDAYGALLAAGLVALKQPDIIASAVPAAGTSALRLQHGHDEVAGSAPQRALATLRLLSIGLGAITVACTHHIARAVFPASGVAAVATLAMASMPQWAASHAVLWHGTLLAMATHLALVLLVRGSVRGRFRLRDGIGAGTSTALALLTAPASWFVVVVGVVTHGLALRAQQRRGEHDARTWSSLVVFVLCAGGAFWLSQHGAPQEAWGRTAVVDASDRGALALVCSFFGEFGRAALPLPTPIMVVTGLVLAIAALGWSRWSLHLSHVPAGLVVLMLSCSMGTCAGVQAALADGMHGRNLLVALGPMQILTAAGLVMVLRRVAPPAWRRHAVHPSAVLWPWLPSVLVLWLQVAPNARLSPVADPHFATLHSGLRTPVAAHVAAQAMTSPPTLSVPRASLTAAADAVFSAVLWCDDQTLVCATYERAGTSLPEPTWPMPPEVFARIAAGSSVWWRMRALPNHTSRAPGSLSAPQRLARSH
jgi:hypothetical protein